MGGDRTNIATLMDKDVVKDPPLQRAFLKECRGQYLRLVLGVICTIAKPSSNKLLLPPLVCLNLLLYGILHRVTNDRCVPLLPHADHSSDGLLFDGRVPLWLENMYTGGSREVEAQRACAESHE